MYTSRLSIFSTSIFPKRHNLSLIKKPLRQNLKRVNSRMDNESKFTLEAKAHLLKVYKSALVSVLPSNLIESQIKIDDKDSQLIFGENSYKLSDDVYLVGFGKAVAGMAYSMEKLLGSRLKRGILSLPKKYSAAVSRKPVKVDEKLKDLEEMLENQLFNTEILRRSKVIECYEGAENNKPDESSLESTNKIVEFVTDLKEKDTLIVLISGGGSALLVQPRQPLTLESKRDVCEKLQLAGADITELNHVRKQLSNVKGGGLAKLAYPANVIALILSDVVGDDLNTIASGPTVPLEPLTEKGKPSAEAMQILKKYNIYAGLDESIPKLLKSASSSSDKKMLAKGKFKHVENIIIGSNATALDAAKTEAKNLGLESFILSRTITGNVKKLSYTYAILARQACLTIFGEFEDEADAVNDEFRLQMEILNMPLGDIKAVFRSLLKMRKNQGILLMAGGEPTVVVSGRGKGGRNQELALTFSLDWLTEVSKDPRLANYCVMFLSAGTDGQDGPTEANGAFGRAAIRPLMQILHDKYKKKVKNERDPEKLEKLNCQLQQITNMIPENVIRLNDTYNFYSRFENGNSHLVTGLTGTNVMDLHFIYIRKKECDCDFDSTNVKDEFEDENILKFLTVKRTEQDPR